MMGDCSSCGPGVSLRKQGDYLHCEVKIIDSNRRKKMRQRYGIELEVYDSMVKTAQGKCAICGDVPKKPLCIDHDHSTGAVRGLLCSPCNSGLGQFRDRPERLLAAVEYLRKANVVA